MTFHILLTTDLSDESARAFERTAKLAARMDASVTLFHAIPEPHVLDSGFPSIPGPLGSEMEDYRTNAEKRMVELRAGLPADLQVEIAMETGDEIARIVTDWAKAHHVDLIAMATHGRTGLRRVMMGSVAEAVLRRSGTPILLFPPED